VTAENCGARGFTHKRSARGDRARGTPVALYEPRRKLAALENYSRRALALRRAVQ
jgi:hypothetical protein